MAIRVLHVIGSLRLGGAQVVVKHIVENASEDFEHMVYPLRPKGAVFDIDTEIIERDWCNYNPRKFFEIIKLVKDRKVDILAVHLSKPIMGGLLATKFCDVKVIVHEHGPLVRPGVQYSFYRFMLKRLWKRAAAFIAVSNDMRDELVSRASIDPSVIKVVPNAVDLSEFDPAKTDRQASRSSMDVEDDDIVIGYVGRLNKVKGIDVLLQSAAKLPERFKVVLAGTGAEEQSLRSLAEELSIEQRVKFLGLCRDVPGLMAGFDIGVVPSRAEPFGIVGLELMRMGVAVVSTGVSGMADYMVDGENSLLVGVDRPDEIAESVQRIINNGQLRQRLIDAGNATAERFSVARCVAAIEDVYKEVLSD
jgi:glycosyltransferase involved in cell wall biosynthesis